jgi:TonB-dependent receptor
MNLCHNVLFVSIASGLLVCGAASAASAQSVNTDGTGAAAAPPQATSADAAPKSTAKNAKSPVELESVQVVGIRASQMRAIELKRTSANIEDSITSVNIGQLPDVSITDSLQRITGVQINRSAGEGTSINVRGLPQVDTTMNGLPFITADNIDSIQPNYGTLPASMFSGVDVYKSPTASMLESGISGTVNLRTYQPFDFKPGWSGTGSINASRGSVAGVRRPDADATISYNDTGHWGVLFSGSYSDQYRNNSSFFYNGGNIAGQNASDANNPDGQGFITSWTSIGLAVPSTVTRLPDGSVEVGGIRNGAFLVGGDGAASLAQQTVQKNRKGAHLAFEANLGSDFQLSLDGFYNRQKESDYSLIAVPEGINHNVATIVPITATPTGVTLTNPAAIPGMQVGDWNQQLYALQSYQYYLGGFRSDTTTTGTLSNARNYTARLVFDNGGPFTAKLSAADNMATQRWVYGDLQFVQDDGSSWGNDLFPGVSLPGTVFPGPPSQGGDHLFNPGGLVPGAESATIDMANGSVGTSSALAARLVDPATYVAKGFDTQGYQQSTFNHYVRFDGTYAFNDNLSLKFGMANSIRSARDFVWSGATPVYAGEGASDPNGCYVRWVYDDQILDGGGVPGACTASNASGYFHAYPIGAVRPNNYPPFVSDNLALFTPEGSGVTVLGLDPRAMKDVMGFFDQLAPGTIQQEDPAASWNTSLHTRLAYGEATFNGEIAGVPFSGNFGLREVRSELGVTQFLSGAPAPYGQQSPAVGTLPTSRTFTDWLPAINVAIDLTPSLVWRMAASKNMMPLTLDQWGGGVSLTYAAVAIKLPDGEHVLPVQGASFAGNPNLNPWRSTNYGSSLEYYINSTSMASIAVFDMHIASFVQSMGSIDCTLPDADGVVRDRCVPVTTLAQGTGAQLKGVELDYKQDLTFLPGLLRNTGFEVNATYSPSSTGSNDLAGESIPFPQNSEKSGNVIAFYQDSRWQARVALSYRSKEAVSSNFLGVNGLEEYEAPQKYIDASVSYHINKHLQAFVQGQNLTNESQTFYLTWPDMHDGIQYSERFYMAGVRGSF